MYSYRKSRTRNNNGRNRYNRIYNPSVPLYSRPTNYQIVGRTLQARPNTLQTDFIQYPITQEKMAVMAKILSENGYGQTTSKEGFQWNIKLTFNDVFDREGALRINADWIFEHIDLGEPLVPQPPTGYYLVHSNTTYCMN